MVKAESFVLLSGKPGESKNILFTATAANGELSCRGHDENPDLKPGI